MKVLVTGANGYIGQGLVRRLLELGVNVIAASRECDNIDERANLIKGNIFDYEDPYKKLCSPDVLIHAAWRKGFVHNDICHLNDLCLHYSFLRKMIDSGLNHMVVLGSMHEIGFFEGCIKNETPCNPQSLYGIAKNSLRQSLELLVKNSDTIFHWIRGFYIVGNYEKGNSIFSKIYQAEKSGHKLFPFTMGQNQWDFIDYDDFCNHVISVSLQSHYQGIVNVCSGNPQKLSERVEHFLKENKFNIKLDYGKFPDRPYDSKAVWGDDSILKKILMN